MLKQYATHWLIIDLIAVVSDWTNISIDLALSNSDKGSIRMELVRLVKFYRLLRLARALRVMKARVVSVLCLGLGGQSWHCAQL